MYKLTLFAACMLLLAQNANAETLEALCEGGNTMLEISDINQEGKLERKSSGSVLYAHALPNYAGQIHFTLTGLPRFEDYPSEKGLPDKVAQSVDLASYPEANTFRTVLKQGFSSIKEEPFSDIIGGKYAAIVNGCGTSCQLYWIVDIETGKILGAIDTNRGLRYRSDSRLLIANLHIDSSQSTKEGLPSVDEYYDHRSAIGFYEIKDGSLSLFRLICTPSPWELMK